VKRIWEIRDYYDGQQISEERDSATPTAWKQIYFWGQYIDELMFFAVPTATVYRVLSDLLYRSIAIVTTANVVTEAYDTDAYGNTLCYSGPGTDGLWFTDDDVRTNNPINSTIYTGRQYDAESQIYYYRARYYNPRTERFISRDPIGTKGGINLYGYCNNNSVIFLDGSGLVAIPTPTGNIILSGQSPLPGNFAPDSAVDYGALWLLGLAPDIVNFGPNDEATQEMMNSLIMNIDRAAMQKILQAYCQNCMAGPTQMSLGGELGKIPPAEYMPYNLGYQLFNSSWEAFVGSWTSGTISASGVDCCLCKANIHIHGINVTGFASLGHGPPVGDGSNYGKSSHLSNKTTGFGHTVTQVFDWDELLEFGPCKHC